MAGGKEVDKLVLRIVADANLLKAELASANNHVAAFALKTATSMKAAGASMMALGRTMTMFVTLPVAAMAAGSVVAFAQFDTAMTKSTAIMSGMNDQLRAEMEATANLIASRTVTSATKAAEAYFFLASAGMDAAESIRALPKVNEFAIAGNFDMALATDLLTDAQSALGLNIGTTTMKMAQMSRVSDVLVRANTLANATVQQFSTALTSKAGAALKAFNKDVEEGVAVLAAMADQGIKAELAGTSLDRMVRLLSQSAIKNKKAHEEMNFAVFDGEGKMRNFADIIGNLETITTGMSDELKVATLAQLGFDARVQQTILPLLGTSKAIKEYEMNLRKASGYTSTVAARNQADFASQMKMTWNEIVLVAKAIGEKLVPMLKWVATTVEDVISFYNGLSEGMKTTILVFIGLVAIAGPLLMILGGTLIMIGGMILGYLNLSAAVATYAATSKIAAVAQWLFNAAAMANPYVWIAAAVLVAVAALVLLVGWLSGAFDAYMKLAAAKKRQQKLDDAWFESQKKTMENNVNEIMQIKDKQKAEKEYELLVKSSRRNAEAKMENIRTEKKLLMQLESQRLAAEKAGDDVAEIDEAIKDAEYMIELQEKQHELLEEQADEYEKMNQLRLIQLQDEKDLAAGNDIRSEIIAEETAAIKEQNEALKEQVATYGMTNSEIEIYRAKLKGATDSQLESSQALADENASMEEQLEAMKEVEQAKEDAIQKEKELAETVKQMNQTLDDQIATFHMTTAEIAEYNAQQLEMSDIDVAIIKMKTEKLEAMKAEKKLLEDNEKATKKLKDEGLALTKSLRKPAEKMKDAQEKLKDMLEQGAIDVETYARAMEKIEKDMKVKVSFKVSGIDAVEAGSLEAIARVEEFRALAEKPKPKVNFREQGEQIQNDFNAEGEAIQAMWEHQANLPMAMQPLPPVANGGMQPVHSVFTSPLKPNDTSPAGVEIPEELRETRDSNEIIAENTTGILEALSTLEGAGL